MVRLVTVSVQNDSGIGAAETTPAPVTPLYHPRLGCSQAMLARDGKDTQTTLRTDCPDLQKYTHGRHTEINSGPDKGFGSHRAVVEITPNEWEMCEGTTMGWGTYVGILFIDQLFQDNAPSSLLLCRCGILKKECYQLICDHARLQGYN